MRTYVLMLLLTLWFLLAGCADVDPNVFLNGLPPPPPAPPVCYWTSIDGQQAFWVCR